MIFLTSENTSHHQQQEHTRDCVICRRRVTAVTNDEERKVWKMLTVRENHFDHFQEPETMVWRIDKLRKRGFDINL